MESDNYYVRFRGQVTGPYTRDQLIARARAGQISHVHSISADKTTWRIAKSHAWLFVAPAAAAQADEPIDSPVGDPVRQKGSDESAKTAIASEQVATAESTDMQFERRSSGHRTWLATALIVILAGLLASGGGYWWMISHRTVTSGIDQPMLSQSLGLIIGGAEIVRYDGTRIEVPDTTGSAFAITTDGYMLTNRHVVKEYDDLSRAGILKKDAETNLKLQLKEKLWVFVAGRKLVAELVFMSERFDLAIIKVPAVFERPFRLRRVNQLTLDEEIRAAGFPAVGTVDVSLSEIEGLQKTIAKDNLHSAVEQYLQPRDYDFVLTSGRISRSTVDNAAGTFWLQHNADVNHGNSGGPLLEVGGAVVGINTLSFTSAGQAGTYFALPLQQAADEINSKAKNVTWVP